MYELLADALGALGLAFGVTALTTFSIRSERFSSLVLGSFVGSTILIFGVLVWAALPPGVDYWLAWTGAAMGLLFTAILGVARHVERRSGVS